MKKTGIHLFVLVGILAVLVIAGDEPPWFDLENCAMCKPMMAEPGFMENVTWENHLVSNGLLQVVTANPGYMEAFKRVTKAAEAISAKLAQGEQMYLCGSCLGYGELMAAGADFENIETMHGSITLITSDKPEVIEKIKAYGQRNIDEMAKMMEMEKEGHEGHDH